VIRCAGDDVLASVLGMMYWHLCWGWYIGVCAGDDVLASVLGMIYWHLYSNWRLDKYNLFDQKWFDQNDCCV